MFVAQIDHVNHIEGGANNRSSLQGFQVGLGYVCYNNFFDI
jgi:hypothetical protein